MYKGLTLITQSLTRCIYFLIIFFFFISLNCSQSSPTDSLSRPRNYDYNLNLVQSIPEKNTFLNYVHSINNFNNTHINNNNNQQQHRRRNLAPAHYRRGESESSPYNQSSRTFDMRNQTFDNKRTTNTTVVARPNGVRHSRRRKRTTSRWLANRPRSIVYERYDATNHVTFINSQLKGQRENGGGDDHDDDVEDDEEEIEVIPPTSNVIQQQRPYIEFKAYKDPNVDYGTRTGTEIVRDAMSVQTIPPTSNMLSNVIGILADAYDGNRSDVFLNRRQARAANPHNKTKTRRSNFCPGNDVGTRTFEAPTVYEGKVRSRNRDYNAVTFEVKNVYKSQSRFKPLVKNETIRLNFSNITNCECIVGGRAGSGTGTVTGTGNGCHMLMLKNGKNYLLFLNRTGLHNYIIIGAPVILTESNRKNVIRNVVDVLNPANLKPANITSLKELPRTSFKPGEKLRFICNVRGNPPPRVNWFKNGTDNFLRSVRQIKVLHHRYRSTLMIAKSRADDAGHYECKARGVVGPPVTRSIHMRLKFDSQDQAPQECERNEYCLNGGNCSFFANLGEMVCECAAGFQGTRCETKMVNTNSKIVRVKILNLTERSKSPLRLNEKLKLVCVVRGHPPPRVKWIRNGSDRFLQSKRVITTYEYTPRHKIRSALVIQKFSAEDAGRYECVAKGATNFDFKSIYVSFVSNECPKEYCLNDGRCTFYREIGEMVCVCAAGFQGTRCETKMVITNLQSTYTPYSCDSRFMAQCT